MPVLQNLYQIFKLTTTQIVENDLNITNYTKSRARKEGTLVSIGDNLVFQQIRRYYDDCRNHREIFEEVQTLRKAVRAYKRNGQQREGNILNQKITDILFVKDIINVEVVTKREYKKLAKGFYVNGVKYVYFCAGSGQIRRNTNTFINEKLYQTIYDNLMCGFLKRVKEFNIAKLHAYFALSFSSVLWVRTPRVCVVKDFFTTIPQQNVDFVHKTPTGKSTVTERVMDIELNSPDGQGLIDPVFAEQWGQDMNLSFTPSSFVVRSVFIKGNLVPFDFKEYAQKNGVSTIRDRWGKSYDINEIDILLSESQFKMYKYYQSWQEYLGYAEQADIKWGVSRYNKKYDDEYVLSNYQYLQCLNITKAEAMELIQPTIEWLHSICEGERVNSLLYIFGACNSDITYKQMSGRAQSVWQKAIVKNNDMLEDTYVQRKIYRNIIESINKAKIGKVWVKGNYSFAISDPIAQCQSALGLEVKGAIPADHIYSQFWHTRTKSKVVSVCRSPMIDEHEHNPSFLYRSDETDYWYQHIKSGAIFSIYDTAVCRMSDSDFDGDLVKISDNEYFIKGAQKHLNIITYEKGSAPTQKINLTNSIKTNLRGLGTGVGGFSNYATIIETMKGWFQKPEQKHQLDELVLRKKLLREIVGQEIDRIKGTAAPVLPKHWKKAEPILPTDTEEETKAKRDMNALVLNKKPYFFRYLYPQLNQRYKQYEAAYDTVSRDMFGMRFKQLLRLENKTDAQKKVVSRYYRFNPLITAPCTMNYICRAFENADFDIKFKKNNVSKLPTFEDEFVFDNYKYQEVKKAYRKYNSRKSNNILNFVLNYSGSVFKEEYSKTIFEIADAIREEVQESLIEKGLMGKELIYYCHKLSKDLKSFKWDFAWDMLEDQIISIIPEGKSYAGVLSEDGIGHHYLGGTYQLVELNRTKKIDIEKEDYEYDDDELFDESFLSDDAFLIFEDDEV